VQAQPRPRQQGADGLGADAQHGGDLGVAQSFEAAERERGALLRAQPPGGRRQARRRGAATAARRATARQQVVGRRARGPEDRVAEALARAREAPELRGGEQEGVLGRVGRGIGAPEDALGEGEDARTVGVSHRGERSGIPRRPRPHQLGLAARHAHGAGSYVRRRAAGRARRTVVRTLRGFPVDRPARVTCGS
jgi:hypothetical protein